MLPSYATGIICHRLTRCLLTPYKPVYVSVYKQIPRNTQFKLHYASTEGQETKKKQSEEVLNPTDHVKLFLRGVIPHT